MEDIALEGEIEDMEWSLDAHDGDIAALLQLVSEDQVAIRFSWPARADLSLRSSWTSTHLTRSLSDHVLTGIAKEQVWHFCPCRDDNDLPSGQTMTILKPAYVSSFPPMCHCRRNRRM